MGPDLLELTIKKRGYRIESQNGWLHTVRRVGVGLFICPDKMDNYGQFGINWKYSINDKIKVHDWFWIILRNFNQDLIFLNGQNVKKI